MLWPRRLVAGLSLWRPRFAPGSVRVGFVVDKVALGQVFSEFFLVNTIPPWSLILMYHLGDEQQARWWLQFRDIVPVIIEYDVNKSKLN
jgi:hypothetical protein